MITQSGLSDIERKEAAFFHEERAQQLIEENRAATLASRPNWAVGHNMPGYLPEGDVGVYANWEDARQDLLDDLARNQDDARHEADFEGHDRQSGVLLHAGSRAMAEVRDLQPGESYSAHIGGLVFWLQPTDEEPDGE